MTPGTVGAVAASFDRAARRYREHARVQESMAAWLAEWLPVERSGRALEIGAGPGVFTAHLLPWPGELLATDISPAMCAAGRAAFPGIRWRQMPAEAPADGPWNWIFSSSMLQWSPQPVAVMAAWRRQLAAGGRVLAGLFVAETLNELHDVTGIDGPVPWRSVAAWRAAVAAAGLRIERDETRSRMFEYPSALELWRSLHAVGAAPERRVSAGQLRQWLKAYDARFRTARDTVWATWSFYRFEAA